MGCELVGVARGAAAAAIVRAGAQLGERPLPQTPWEVFAAGDKWWRE